MPPEVIVHHLAQAKGALRAAKEAGVGIRLRSARHAAAAAGVGYLRAMGEAAGHELMIDCGDDAGLVMAALRAGCSRLIFTGPDELGRRLRQMAGRRGARLRGPTDPSPPCLDLLPEEDGARVRAWLDAACRA